MKLSIEERVLHFKQPAGTSRGVYRERRSWMVTAEDVVDGAARRGVGECAPLPALSCDDVADYAAVLRRFCDQVEQTGAIPYDDLRPYPSMLFGIETALTALRRGSHVLFDTPFGRGEEGIPINGLVWMGTYEEMLARMEEKMRLGFRCIKLKIGAIDFDSELDLIRRIRSRFSREDIELRVDANGAFSPADALTKLEALAQYDIHSIEQPIRAGQWEAMADLCRRSPLPVALDEELIGVNAPGRKATLLDTIRPAFIVLKPSLHGGMGGTAEWVRMADERGIGSWITSALESNVGLNAIAHLTAHIYGSGITRPQGLGTGALFTDNIDMPLEIRGDELWMTATDGEKDTKTDMDSETKAEADTKTSTASETDADAVSDVEAEWLNDSDSMLVHTSGSTGEPKPLWVKKRRMQASAERTCRFLGLKAGDTALLCLPTNYIAGKMMVVRSLVCGLQLTRVAPSGHPLATVGDRSFDFVAMVPMQVYNSLGVPAERAALMRIRHLIIGGGAIDETLEEALRPLPNAIWATYGMTETLSHIALRRVNGTEASLWFTPMDGITVSTDEDNCLIINAPAICDTPIQTNDIAVLAPDGCRFRILGRRDNIICSGGIKIQPEELERTLRPHLPFPFLISKRPDPRLGECVVMLIAGTSPDAIAQARQACATHLPKHHRPRHFLLVDSIPMTATAKPARKAAETLAGGVV